MTKRLLEKLVLYGFDESALSWIRSYLLDRSQSVYIEGAMSEALTMECGVPQGSVLGPLLYILYMNDLPEVIHQVAHQHQEENVDNPYNYNIHCHTCGGLCLYADDSTCTISNKDVVQLNEDIDNAYKTISQYMARNKLILNSDKTHLLVMSSATLVSL